MQNQPVEVKTPQLDWSAFLRLFSPVGERQIAELVATAREKYADRWLEGIQAEFPEFCWIIDLVANHTDEEALDAAVAAYPTLPVRWAIGKQIKTMHGRLREEIDKKRDI